MSLIHLPAPRLCPPCGQVHRPRIDRNLAHQLRPFDAFYLSAAAKNLMLDALDESLGTGADFGGLHTAYSTTGANELTGGSPAYARKALAWSAAAAGAKALTTFPTWDIPPSTTFGWWSGWDAVTTGTFLFMMPIGASLPTNMSCDAGNVTDNLIASEAHGLVADSRCVFWPGSGSGLPAGLSVGTIYWVIAAGLTVDVFSVSTTQGGSAVDITDEGGGLVQKCVPETYGSQGTYALQATSSIDLAAVV